MSSQELNHQQLNDLYTENQGWLRGWLHNRLGCSHRASDLLHDTFMRILARDELLELQKPKAYLMAITKRVLVDHWRREKVEQAYLDALAALPESYVQAPEEQQIMLETLIEIDALLDGLPVVVKRTFLYAQLDGMKQQEIAEKLNISISTVKRHLVRAAGQCYFALEMEA